jgi:uncharacterized Fe-S radical SAM superfamily protein PflX
MKKTVLTIVIVLSLGLLTTSCKENKKEEAESKEELIEVVEISEIKVIDSNVVAASDEMAMATYQCPMKCEVDKTYSKHGSCPVCKMDLKEVKKGDKEEGHEGHDHE